MKVLKWILIGLAIILGIVYTLAFTSIGNKILKPTLQAKAQELSGLVFTLETYKLSTDSFEVKLAFDPQNSFIVRGNYSLIAQNFNIVYALSFQKLENLEAITQKPLQGSFATNGTVVGDMAFLKIDGVSDFALSKSEYHLELKDLEPSSVVAHVNSLSLSKLLFTLKEKQYAAASINLDLAFKDSDPKSLDGSITLKTTQGTFN